MRPSPVFYRDILEHLDVKCLVGHEPLVPSILLVERLEPAGLRHSQVAEFLLPAVVRLLRDAVAATNAGNLRAASEFA